MENRIRKSSILSVDVPEKQIIEIIAKKRKCLKLFYILLRIRPYKTSKLKETFLKVAQEP